MPKPIIYSRTRTWKGQRPVHIVASSRNLADQFWHDGFVIERAVFERAEVERWRRRALEIGPTGRDLFSDPVLAEIVCDPRVVDRARAVLGGQPVYFGDSVAAVSGPAIAGFHKDCSDRYDGAAPDWQVDRYPILRFGIYAQDHAGLPGGLDLRQGSHRHPDITSGRWKYADTRVGDLVFWSGRTTHSGPSMMLKGGHRVKPNGLIWRVLARVKREPLLRQLPGDRLGLFVSYGVEHPLLTRHIDYLRTRTYAVEQARASTWSEAARAMARASGLALIEPEERVAGAGQTWDDYRQLPY